MYSQSPNLSLPHLRTVLTEQGALLNEAPTGDDPTKYSFAGSTIVVQAASREEIKEILRKDIYAKSGVWDVENVSLPYLITCTNSWV